MTERRIIGADIVRLLLAAKADVSAQDNDGKTALKLALQNDHAEVSNLFTSAMAAAVPAQKWPVVNLADSSVSLERANREWPEERPQVLDERHVPLLDRKLRPSGGLIQIAA